MVTLIIGDVVLVTFVIVLLELEELVALVVFVLLVFVWLFAFVFVVMFVVFDAALLGFTLSTMKLAGKFLTHEEFDGKYA